MLSESPTHEDIMIPADPGEEWPCFENHTVRVRLRFPPAVLSSKHSVAIWVVEASGTTGLGFEAIFFSEERARRIISEMPSPLPKKWFWDRGFGYT